MIITLGVILWAFDFFQVETFPVLTSSTVYDRLACVRGYAQSLFVLLRHVYLECPKSTTLGRGGIGTLFVPPFRRVLVHSSSSRSSL